MWPLCMPDAVQEIQGAQQEGKWTGWITSWISITTGWITNDEIQGLVGWGQAAVKQQVKCYTAFC